MRPRASQASLSACCTSSSSFCVLLYLPAHTGGCHTGLGQAVLT